MKTREIVTMGILSAILLAAQVSLGFLPNIELVTLLLIVYTLVLKKKVFFVIYVFVLLEVLWSSIFVTLMANKIGGLQFGIYRNCQISSRVSHTAVAALPLTKANRSDFE